jgi:hypothetical protein
LPTLLLKTRFCEVITRRYICITPSPRGVISINEIELLKLGFSLSSEPANNDSWHILGVMIRQLFYYQNNLYLSFIIYLEDCLLSLGYYDQYDLVQTLQQIHFQYHFYSRLQIHPRTCYQKLNQSALLAHH